MLRLGIAAVFACFAAGAVNAQTIEEKAAICGACHGEKGVPIEKSIPIIWGQNTGYLYLQFRDFQKGARKDDRMTPIAQSVDREDALAIAEYFAAKPWPNLGAPAAAKADEDAAVGVNKSVVCTSCHLDQFRGDSSVPRLAGQQRDYVIKAMLDFRTRIRANNPGMSDLMNSVTPEQLQAMASYLAGL
jgi:cytochrome c553